MKDAFTVRRGVQCLGLHKTLDYEGVSSGRLSDEAFIRNALESAVAAGKATQLYGYFHKFAGGGEGVTGFIALAESHISIHTWPEEGAALLDVFMCGNTDMDACLKSLKRSFRPSKIHRHLIYRGRDLAAPQPDLFKKDKRAA